MILITELNSFVKKIIDINSYNFKFNYSPEITFFFKYTIASCNVSLLLLVFALIINIIFSIFFKSYTAAFSFLKYFSMLIVTIILIIFMIKFYITLKIESVLGSQILTLKLNFFKQNANIPFIEMYTLFSSSFGDAILILCIIVGLVCLELLGPKNIFQSINNISIFFLFTFFVTIMISTTNLLIMFISFEFIFLPTIYFAYTLGYTKKIDSASKMLIYWTLFGSFLVLSNLGYLYYQYKTLNYFFLLQKKFSQQELIFLFFNFLLGFGIKIPIAPLHFWLLKVHVEAPTAFSIYLSGFLVKAALYCFYMFLSLFNNNNLYTYLIIWVIYSLLISTLGLARQVDIKKLIAWATVQEMSFILLFLLLKQLVLTHTCIIFTLLHGLMSSYMFFLVDILQRRYKTRSLKFITGLNMFFPELTKYVWFLILLFSGFPLTVKFFIEWSLISLLLETNRFVLLIVLFFINFLGVIFFCKIMFTILYGAPPKQDADLEFFEIQKKEKVILQLLAFIIMVLIAFMYFI